MNDRAKKPALQIKEFLTRRYGDQIRTIILYGSYARGEERPESDLDLLAVVDDALSPPRVRAELSEILYDLFLETGELVSVMVIPESLFKNYNSPFLLNVRAEGVRL